MQITKNIIIGKKHTGVGYLLKDKNLNLLSQNSIEIMPSVIRTSQNRWYMSPARLLKSAWQLCFSITNDVSSAIIEDGRCLPAKILGSLHAEKSLPSLRSAHRGRLRVSRYVNVDPIEAVFRTPNVLYYEQVGFLRIFECVLFLLRILISDTISTGKNPVQTLFHQTQGRRMLRFMLPMVGIMDQTITFARRWRLMWWTLS